MTPTSEYRLIPLTQGQHAIVDVADYEWLSQWKWRAQWSRDTRSFYAVREAWLDGKGLSVLMHRLILGLEFRDKRQGDHRNLNTLDNRRNNVRIATARQNSCNQRVRSDNTSGIKGVSWSNKDKRWRAQIKVQGRLIFLGNFLTAEAAHAAYCKAATQLHGEFRRIA